MAYVKQEWKDEVLNGAEKYKITRSDGTILADNVSVELITQILQAGTPITAERMNHIEDGIADFYTYGWKILPLINGWGQYLTWGRAQIAKWGNAVSVRGIAGRNGSTSRIIATIPAAYRPGYHFWGMAVFGNGKVTPILVKTNGEMSLVGSEPLEDYYYLNLVWVI